MGKRKTLTERLTEALEAWQKARDREARAEAEVARKKKAAEDARAAITPPTVPPLWLMDFAQAKHLEIAEREHLDAVDKYVDAARKRIEAERKLRGVVEEVAKRLDEAPEKR